MTIHFEKLIEKNSKNKSKIKRQIVLKVKIGIEIKYVSIKIEKKSS